VKLAIGKSRATVMAEPPVKSTRRRLCASGISSITPVPTHPAAARAAEKGFCDHARGATARARARAERQNEVRRVRRRLLEHRGEAIAGEVGLIDHFVNDDVRFWAVRPWWSGMTVLPSSTPCIAATRPSRLSYTRSTFWSTTGRTMASSRPSASTPTPHPRPGKELGRLRERNARHRKNPAGSREHAAQR
jgi:hypothetical protein